MLPTNMLNISFGRKLRDSVRRLSQQEPAGWVPTLLRRNDGHQSAFASYRSLTLHTYITYFTPEAVRDISDIPQRHLRYSSETSQIFLRDSSDIPQRHPYFNKNNLTMRNTHLVAFYSRHPGRKGGVVFFCSVPYPRKKRCYYFFLSRTPPFLVTSLK
jgi:hypothetical protein